MRWPLILACLAGGGAVACQETASQVRRLEVGTGTTSFVPLEGGTVELVHGPQGGWHLDVTLRLWDEAPDGVLLDYEVRRQGEDTPVSTPTQYRVAEERLVRESDHWLRLGDRVVFAISDPSEVLGAVVEVRAVIDPVEDRDSATVVDVL